MIYNQQSVNNNSPFGNFLSKLPDFVGANNSLGSNTGQNYYSPVIRIDEINKSEKHRLLNWKTAAGAVVIGGVGLFFAKGVTTNLFTKASRVFDLLDDKIYKFSNKNPHLKLDLFRNTAVYMMQKAQGVTSLVKAMANFTAIKDLFCLNILEKIRLKTLSDYITRTFKSIIGSSYDLIFSKVSLKVENRIANLLEISNKLKTQTGAKVQSVNLIETQINGVMSSYHSNFSKAARASRLAQYSKDIGSLRNNAESLIKTNGLNLSKYSTYITEELSTPALQKQKQAVTNIKKYMTNNIDNNHESVASTINEIRSIIKPSDKGVRGLLRNLMQEMNNYKELGGKEENLLRRKSTEKIFQIIDETKKLVQNNKHYGSDTTGNIINHLTNIEDTLASSKKGKLQDILTSIKEIVGKDSPLYKKAVQEVKGIDSALSDGIKAETSVYNKYAEMEVGSAPTDVAGLLLTAGAGAALVAKARDLDGYVEASLKGGIPILSVLATCTYCTMRMKSNMYGLGLGLAAGYVLNRVGDKVNELYKKIRQNQTTTKAALAEYEKLKRQDKSVASADIAQRQV